MLLGGYFASDHFTASHMAPLDAMNKKLKENRG